MVIETVGVITLAAAIGYIVRGHVTKPEPKKEIPVKNKEEEFSEPVATFIKLFNENPKRFPLTKEHRFDEFGRLFSTIGGYHRKRQAKCRQISPNRARRALINIYKDEM